MEKTGNRRSFLGFDNDLLNKIITGYDLKPWFKNSVNLENLALKNVIWWYQDVIVVPMIDSLRNDIFIKCHDAIYSRHMDISKTLKLIEKNFWWPNLRNNIKSYVNSCDVYQCSKASTTRIVALLQPLEILKKKWEYVSLDFIIELTFTRQGHDAILVCVDKLSKMAHFIATVTIVTIEETTRLFIDHIHKHHGLPLKIVIVRDTRLTSRFWVALCHILGIRQAMSSTFHPQSNG